MLLGAQTAKQVQSKVCSSWARVARTCDEVFEHRGEEHDNLRVAERGEGHLV